MSASGKDLEDLVARIERRISSAGFSVAQRVTPRDENGMQLAEFDVLITGKSGNQESKLLLECRDRAEPQGIPWIEQLIGRRTVHGFDRVWAVSSSGFSKPAIKIAEEFDIGLRTVRQIEDIEDDINLVDVAFNVYKAEVTDARAMISSDGTPSHVEIPQNSRVLLDGSWLPLKAYFAILEMRLDLSQMRDPRPIKEQFEGINELAQMDQMAVIGNMLRTQRKVGAVVRSTREKTISGSLNVRTSAGERQYESVTCTISISVQIQKAKFVSLNLYQGNAEVIGAESVFRLSLNGKLWPCRALETKREDGHISLEFDFGNDFPAVLNIVRYRRLRPS